MNIEQKSRELVNLCGHAPQEINSLLPKKIKTQLIAMCAFEQVWQYMGQPRKIVQSRTLLTTEDLRELTRVYLQRCSKEALPSLLGLDVWQTTGQKEEACRRIIDSLVNSDVGLDLKDLQLSSLPKAIGHLSHLQALVCSYNQLTYLPETIGQLSNLQALDCTNNKLTYLPETIVQLSNLQAIGCSHNKLNFLPKTIGQLSNLKLLDCSDNRLTLLPEAIGQLSDLEMLYCDSNQLTCVPEVIGQLSHLQELDLCDNQLTLLPETIGKLSKLKKLNCHRNQLSFLPEAIGNLSNLQTLHCSSNPTLTGLPLGIFNLSLRCTINMTGTGLSQSVLERIDGIVSSTYYTGPTISHSIIGDIFEEEKSFNKLLNAVYTPLKRNVPEQLTILSEDAAQAKSFCSWLNRLSWTADMQNIKESKKRFFYQAIADIIEFAASNQSYRTLFQTILLDASETCGDRVTLSILQLEIAKQEITIDKTNLFALADFLKRGHLAMQLLEKIAREKTLTLRLFDEVEIYLAYPIQLKEALKLPFSTEKMRFMCCSRVTDEDLKLAQEAVETELSNHNAVVNFLIKNNTWMEALQKHFPEKFETIQKAATEEGKDPTEAYRALTFEALSNYVSQMSLLSI